MFQFAHVFVAHYFSLSKKEEGYARTSILWNWNWCKRRRRTLSIRMNESGKMAHGKENVGSFCDGNINHILRNVWRKWQTLGKISEGWRTVKKKNTNTRISIFFSSFFLISWHLFEWMAWLPVWENARSAHGHSKDFTCTYPHLTYTNNATSLQWILNVFNAVARMKKSTQQSFAMLFWAVFARFKHELLRYQRTILNTDFMKMHV